MNKADKYNLELLGEINETRLVEGKIALWWLGQSGFVIKFGKTIVYIDPYLSDYCRENLKLNHTRLTEIPIKPELIDNASVVICTHDHADHLDPETITAIADSSPETMFIIPLAAKKTLLELQISGKRIIHTNPGKQIDVCDIKICPVAAKHEEFNENKETGFPYQGYVIQYGSIAIYYAGDCIPYDGLIDILRPFNIDIAILPINGRDRKRHELGFKGNFTYQEACWLGWQVKAKTIIPMHYDMFALNTEDVDNFIYHIEKTYPLQKYMVLKCGEKMDYKKEIM